MIQIVINGNRSDIAGYISYYACNEIAPLLGVLKEEIEFKSIVSDDFAFGDIDVNPRVEALVIMDRRYSNYIEQLNEILAKYLNGFVVEFRIRYELIDIDYCYEYKGINKE